MSKLKRIAPYLLICLGYTLRILRLDDKSIWWDEGYTAWLSRADFATIIFDLSSTDTSPPLHYVLLHAWRLLTGETAFALRYFSLLAGILTIAVVYRIGKAIAQETDLRQSQTALGLLSALILAINRFHISWSQEVRNYALGSLVATLAIWGALRVWQRHHVTLIDMAFYVLAMTAALYTNYLGAFVLIAINLAWLWEWAKRQDRWRQFWRWSLMQVAVLALFVPWGAYVIGRIPTWDADSRVDLTTFAKVTWATLNVGIPANFEQFYSLTIPLFVFFLIGLLHIIWQGRHNWRVGRNLTLTLIGLLIPGILIFLLTLPGRDFLYTPPVAPRYFMFFVAIYCVGMAWCLMSLIRLVSFWKSADAVVTVAVIGFAIWVAWAGLRPYYKTRDIIDRYQSLTATIHAHERNDAVVLLPDTDWPTFDFYYGAGWRGVSNSWLLDDWQTNEVLASLWGEHDGVWLVSAPHAPITDPNRLMEQWLANRAVATMTYDFGEHQVIFYAKTETRATEMQRVETSRIRFPYAQATTDVFQGHDLFLDDVRSGDALFLGLHFKTLPDDPLTGVQLRLVDQANEVLIALPIAFANGGDVRQAVKLTIPAEAETGVHRLVLQVDGQEAVRDFGRIHITQRHNTFFTEADINPTQPLNETFTNGIELLGYDLDPRQSYTPDSQIPLTLYWKSAGGIDTRYKVFTHLLGEIYNADQNNFLWGQQDNQPQNGSRPTSSWRADEIIIDRYAMPILSNAPVGRYRIEIGLYDPNTGERLLLDDGRDHLILDSVTLAPK